MVFQRPYSPLDYLKAAFEGNEKYAKASDNELIVMVASKGPSSHNAYQELKRRGFSDIDIKARASSIHF